MRIGVPQSPGPGRQTRRSRSSLRNASNDAGGVFDRYEVWIGAIARVNRSVRGFRPVDAKQRIVPSHTRGMRGCVRSGHGIDDFGAFGQSLESMRYTLGYVQRAAVLLVQFNAEPLA